MNRRTFLGGLGASLTAATLGSWGRGALANGGLPCRFVFVIEGNGVEPTAFMSTDARAAIEADLTQASAGRRWYPHLYGHGAPLELTGDNLGTASVLNPLVGAAGELDLTSRSAVVLGLSSTITGGGHSTSTGALSCSRSSPTRPAGQTIDSLLANQVGALTPFDAIRLGVHSSASSLNTGLCAYGAGRAAPMLMHAERAYGNIFGAFAADSSSFNAQNRKLEFARDAADRALNDYIGPDVERAKLVTYHQAILDLSERQSALATIAAGYDPTDPLEPMQVPPEPDLDPRYRSDSPLERFEMQVEIATAALQGGLTNVAVLGSGVGGAFSIAYPNLATQYSSIDAAITRHDLQHGAAGNPEFRELIHDATRAHVAMIAKMARALAATPEGSGSMLDNTVIIFMSDNGEQHHSKAEEWPILMVGGNNLNFRTDGRTVVYPGIQHPNNRQVSNFFNTLGHAAGLPLDDFGNEGRDRLAAGPLAELRL